MQEPRVVSCKVLKESPGDHKLAHYLRCTLRHNSLDELDKIVLNFRFAHFCGNLEEDIPVHGVPMDILNRIMQPILGHFPL